MSVHTCPAPGCEKKVPDYQLACQAHWFSLPKPLRTQVWRAYRGPGPGSPEHDAAIREAINHLREHQA